MVSAKLNTPNLPRSNLKVLPNQNPRKNKKHPKLRKRWCRKLMKPKN